VDRTPASNLPDGAIKKAQTQKPADSKTKQKLLAAAPHQNNADGAKKKALGEAQDQKEGNGDEESDMTALQLALTGVPAPVQVVDLLLRTSCTRLAEYGEHRRV
jgi:hypothetical protein